MSDLLTTKITERLDAGMRQSNRIPQGSDEQVRRAKSARRHEVDWRQEIEMPGGDADGNPEVRTQVAGHGATRRPANGISPPIALCRSSEAICLAPIASIDCIRDSARPRKRVHRSLLYRSQEVTSFGASHAAFAICKMPACLSGRHAFMPSSR